ncbi:MAG: FAD-binding oxidoreductase [Alphaproteobacteria bacterium]|nr:FAD-binding oxidoreductase [Alphaproteobacteria bacterium]
MIAGSPPRRPSAARPGPPPDRADVVVVGGDLPALCAALWLARAGTDVLLLAAGPTLGDEVTARAPGLGFQGLEEHAWRLAAAVGTQDAAGLYRASAEGLALLASEVAVDRAGIVWAATEQDREPTELDRSREVLRTWGLAPEPCTGPQVDARVGSTGLGPGLVLPGDLGFDGPAVVDALAASLDAAGASWHTDVAVEAVEPQGDALEVQHADGRVRAEVVILAAGHRLRPLHEIFRQTLSPVRQTAIALAGAPPMSHGLRAGFGYTLGQRQGDHLVLAGCRWASPHLEEGERDRDVLDPRVVERLEATATRFFPGAGPVTHRWAWITAASCDGLPLVGPLPGDPRRLLCCGFAGGEAGLGVRGARAVVDGLLTGRADGLPRRLDPARMLL